MSKKLLIDTNNEDETRVALLNEGKLDDFEIELNKTSVNIKAYSANTNSKTLNNKIKCEVLCW